MRPSLAFLIFFTSTAGAHNPPAQKPWMDKTLSPDRRADLLTAQMTLDEKILLIHGGTNYEVWFANIPSDPQSCLSGQ